MLSSLNPKNQIVLTVVAAERVTVIYSVVRQVWEGFVHCIVGVSWEVWQHVMSVIVVGRVTQGTAGQMNVDGYPKRPVNHMCETNGANLTAKCLNRPVM